jgi:choline monooxygenase
MDLMSMAQIVVPTSPTTSRTMVWLFAPFGPRRGVLPWLFAKGNALASKEITKRVLAEDAPIFADVQRGLEASPIRGVIGRREERVWAFQDHVARLSAVRQPG